MNMNQHGFCKMSFFLMMFFCVSGSIFAMQQSCNQDFRNSVDLSVERENEYQYQEHKEDEEEILKYCDAIDYQTLGLLQDLSLDEEKVSAEKKKFFSFSKSERLQFVTVPPTELKEALFDAIEKKESKKFEQLLKNGADVNCRNDQGETLLHAAVRLKAYEIVKILIAHKAKVNIQKLIGFTPLHLAVCYADFTLIKLLIRAGANPYIQNSDGCNVYQLAVREDVRKVIDRQMLIQKLKKVGSCCFL